MTSFIAGLIGVLGAGLTFFIWYFISMIKRNERLSLEQKAKEYKDAVEKKRKERKQSIEHLVSSRKSASRAKLRKKHKPKVRPS